MTAVLVPDDIHHTIFYQGIGLLDRFTAHASFTENYYLLLVLYRNPGVWDDNVQQNGMCPATMGTLKTLNTEDDLRTPEPYGSLIVAKFPHIATMPARACNLMKLQTGHYGIIFFLSKGIDILCLNCYHSSGVNMRQLISAGI